MYQRICSIKLYNYLNKIFQMSFRQKTSDLFQKIKVKIISNPFLIALIVVILSGLYLGTFRTRGETEFYLLKKMEFIFKQKFDLYENWDNQDQLKAREILSEINKIRASTSTGKEQKLNQIYKFSPAKQEQFKRLQFQINQVERQRDFNFHAYQSQKSKTEPICPNRTKIQVQGKSFYIPSTKELSKYNMSNDMIIVTPIGEYPQIQILFQYLQKQKDSFSEWHIWLKRSTVNVQSIVKLAGENNWIKIIRLQSDELDQNYLTFWQKDCLPGKIYLRIQSQVVWISSNFVSKMFENRIKHPDHLLVYPNTINNGIMDYINQHSGNFNFSEVAHHDCEGFTWRSKQIVKKIHQEFLESAQSLTTEKWALSFKKWFALSYERIEMNSVVYFSDTIRQLQYNKNQQQEALFSVDLPFSYQKPNLLIGDALCVNYASPHQEQLLKKSYPEIIQKYRKIAQIK